MTDPRVDPDDRLGLDVASVTTGMGVWVGVSLLLAVASLGQTALPAVSLAAALVGTAVVALVLLPLRRGRSTAPVLTCAVCVLGVAAASSTNAALVQPAHAESYAVWFPGLVTGAIGGLAVRHRPGAALLTAASSLAALAWMLAVRLDGPGRLGLFVVLCTPVLLWSLGGLVLTRLIDLSQIELSRSRTELTTALGRRELDRSLADAREQRQALLSRSAIPLLEVISREGDTGRSWSPGVLDQITEANADLRAEIRGRTLLDERVRQAVRDARLRGVEVSLLDDAPPGAEVSGLPRLRHLVRTVVEAAVDGEVIARRPSSGLGLTVVHVGGPLSRRRCADAVLALPAHLRSGLELTDDEDSVVLEVVR